MNEVPLTPLRFSAWMDWYTFYLLPTIYFVAPPAPGGVVVAWLGLRLEYGRQVDWDKVPPP